MSKRYTDEFLEEVYNYMQKTGKGICAVARHFDVCQSTLSKRLKEKYDDTIIRKNGKLKVDSNYFKVIDNEHKAYWLGFLTADGYLCPQKNRLDLRLAEVDKKHIELFKEDIKSEHKISPSQSELYGKKFISYGITIQDKEISNDLVKLGFTSDKSHDANIPFNKIPKDLLRHYIRGLMDGDGSVMKINKGRGVGAVICTTVSCQLIDDITRCIKDEININVKYRISKVKNPIDICIYKQEEADKFFDWIYKDSTIYLDRKYEKYAVLRQGCKKSQNN